MRCKHKWRCQRERETGDFHQKNTQERCFVKLFSMWWPTYYCYLISHKRKEKRNTHETSTALSESDTSLKKAYLNANLRKCLACLLAVFLGGFFPSSFCPLPLLAVVEKQRDHFCFFVWFYQGVSPNFPLIRATIASSPLGELGSGNKKSTRKTAQLSVRPPSGSNHHTFIQTHNSTDSRWKVAKYLDFMSLIWQISSISIFFLGL